MTQNAQTRLRLSVSRETSAWPHRPQVLTVIGQTFVQRVQATRSRSLALMKFSDFPETRQRPKAKHRLGQAKRIHCATRRFFVQHNGQEDIDRQQRPEQWHKDDQCSSGQRQKNHRAVGKRQCRVDNRNSILCACCINRQKREYRGTDDQKGNRQRHRNDPQARIFPWRNQDLVATLTLRTSYLRATCATARPAAFLQCDRRCLS